MLPMFRKHTIYDESNINLDTSQDHHPKNVIVFGESGVGKSSLINLLAGEKVSEISSGTLGCTLAYKRHLLNLDSQRFAIWDTAGLNEGTQGTVPAEKAEAYLKQLLHDLAKNDGVDLLVYCVRGTRVRSALLTNYHIFYTAICRKKVPITIVVTGLENQEGSMETWWYENEPQFSLLKTYFDGHACVTTLESSVENAILRERQEVSKAVVSKMIINTCRSQRWNPSERSWVDSACSDIRAMLSPRDAYGTRLPTIIMCEVSRKCPSRQLTRKRSISFQNPVAFSLSFCPLSFRSPVSISNESKLPFEEGIRCTPDRLYRVYQVPRKRPSLEEMGEETRNVTVVKRGADLLIFCIKMQELEVKPVKFQWEHFNITYGGDLSPRIVVVVGAVDQSSAEEWWKAVIGGTPVRDDVTVTYCPSNDGGSDVEDARMRLRCLINDRCIDCSTKATLVRNENLFRRSLRLDMSSLITLRVKLENNSKEDGASSPEQDLLTELGVWDHWTPEGSPITSIPISPNWTQEP